MAKPSLLVLSVVFCAGIALCSAECGELFESEVGDEDKAIIVKKHNDLRSLITEGKVPGQPKGTNLKEIQWDDTLATEAQKIANSCEFQHVEVHDNRFDVGQNLWRDGSSVRKGAEWDHVIQGWFNEYGNFQYPTTSKGATGHYTQVVWADTNLVGCGFASYGKDTLHEKLYVCNYGPGGNVIGLAPYRT